jgi:hypothetical protein
MLRRGVSKQAQSDRIRILPCRIELSRYFGGPFTFALRLESGAQSKERPTVPSRALFWRG